MSGFRFVTVLVEGQTEFNLVDQAIKEPLLRAGVILTPVILKTSRPAARAAGRGGVSRWSRIRREIQGLLGDPRTTCVTTLLDYYGLPSDTPGMNNRPVSDAYRRVRHVEAAMAADIADDRFLPFAALHETETYVLAAAQALGKDFDELLVVPGVADSLALQVRRAGGPELVNDGQSSAPAKRILSACPTYRKTSDGPDAIELLGLAALREVCPHLDEWLGQLERLSSGSGQP